MRRGAALAALAGLIGVGAACCPIPLTRDVTVRPQLALEVRTHEGKPADGVDLTVRRLVTGPPPLTETERWTATTGPDGRVRLDAIERRERYAPLMMHGVNWYGWEVCAEHPKYGSGSARHDGTAPVVGPVSLTIDLDTSRADCGWEVLDTWEIAPIDG